MLEPENAVMIVIKAQEVVNNGNGTFSVLIPTQHISPEQQKVVQDLLPNLSEQFFVLLNKEALLGCLATDADRAIPPPEYVKPEVVKPTKKSY